MIAVVDSGMAAIRGFADEGYLDAESADCVNGPTRCAPTGSPHPSDVDTTSSGHGTMSRRSPPRRPTAWARSASRRTRTHRSWCAIDGRRPSACLRVQLPRAADRTGAVGLLVVNLSLVRPAAPSPPCSGALTAAHGPGALVVGAAGNDGGGRAPAGLPARAARAGRRRDEGEALLAGPQLDLVAPGRRTCCCPTSPARGGRRRPGTSLRHRSWPPAPRRACGAPARRLGADGAAGRVRSCASPPERDDRGARARASGWSTSGKRCTSTPAQDPARRRVGAQRQRRRRQRRPRCTRTCKLTRPRARRRDDDPDYWRLIAAVPAAAKVCRQVARGVSAWSRHRARPACVRVRPKQRSRLYTVNVPRR